MPASQRSKTLEGQVVRVADLTAYVNHDIDDAQRAGILKVEDLPRDAVALLGETSSARIGRMVKDVVEATFAGNLTEVRMSQAVLDATLELRKFLFAAVYENEAATAEFKKATGILGGLWEKVRERPGDFLDPRTMAEEGLDAAARDFLAGMTDRYAVNLFETLFIPKPWVGPLEIEPSSASHIIVVLPRLNPRRSRVMQLSLRSYKTPEHVEKRYEPSLFPAADGDAFRVVSPVVLSFDIDRQDTGRYRLAGHLSGELELNCGRCLEPFRLPVSSDFDLRYVPRTENTGEGEEEVEEDDLSTAYYDND